MCLHQQRRVILACVGHLPCAVAVLVALLCAARMSAEEPAKDPGIPTLPPPGPTSWASFRNGNAQLGIAHCELPEKLKLLWKVPATDGVVSAPAIVGQHVYVGILGGDLLCLDRKTGKIVWKYTTVEKKTPNTFAPGFQSSPTVTADGVYLGDEDGVYHAVDRATGKKRWTFQANAEIISSTNVVGNRLIFGCYDSNLYCLNAQDGSVIWQFTTEDRVNGTPAIAEHFSFITGCDSQMRIINIDTGKQEAQMSLETFLIASPAVKGDMLYVGTYASEVLAVNWKKREIVWRYRDPEREYPYHSSAAVTEKYVVVGSRDKQVHCIDRKTGKRVWVFGTRGRVDSSPAIVGDHVFVGSQDGNLYELNLADGTLLWKFTAGHPISSSPAIGEGCLAIGSEGSDGMIYCFGKQ